MVDAIETRYRGYRFRSRLEARWAVFFDHMGIEFQYEPEGYKLPSGWYLPDFWLPQVDMWAEVKQNKFSAHEYALAYELSHETSHPCLMLVGEPDFKPYESVTVVKGVDEFGGVVHDDIMILYCLVSEYLVEHNFYYCQSDSEALDDYGPAHRNAVNEARGARFDS